MSSASTLPNPLLSAAIAYPDRPYVNGLTYAALCRGVQARAIALSALNLTWQEERVGLCGSYDERWVEWALTLNWLGALVAPLKPDGTSRERSSVASRLSLTRVITLPREGRASCGGEPLLSEAAYQRMDAHALSLSDPCGAPVDWGWERPIFALTTSGTTGAPKPITLTTRALIMSAFGSMVRLGHLASDRWLACLPLHHVGGLSILTRALVQQTSVRLCPPRGDLIAEALVSGAYQLCSLTPSLLSETLERLEGLTEGERGGLNKVRALLIGGARTPHTVWERAEALGLPIRLTWGMSEAASQVCTQLVSAPPGGALPPLPFQSITVSAEGSLTLRSPTTEQGVYESQDLGELDERGWVKVSGRRDDIIISGGVNIHPREVEERLLAHPSVAEVAVVGAPDPGWGQALHAHLRLKRGEERPSDEALRAWCRLELSSYKCPKAFHWRQSLPRDPLGKLLRRHLTPPPHESEGTL